MVLLLKSSLSGLLVQTRLLFIGLLGVDLIELLKNTRDNRNNMAHSFLVDTMISKSLGFGMESIEVRQLDKYIRELENVILFWEWCVKHEVLIP